MNTNDASAGLQAANSLKAAVPARLASPASVLSMAARVLGALTLVAMSLFCGYGFLESFEPGNGLMWKLGYGMLACGLVLEAMALLWKPRKNA